MRGTTGTRGRMASRDHHIPADLDAPAVGRRLLRSWMGDDPRTPDAVLAVSELVANAVVHGGAETEARGLVIHMRDDGTTRRIEVRQPAEQRGIRRPQESSRGLALVEAAVDRWGVDEDADRLIVWFEIDTAAAASGRR